MVETNTQNETMKTTPTTRTARAASAPVAYDALATARLMAFYQQRFEVIVADRGGAGTFLEASGRFAQRIAQRYHGKAREELLGWLAGAITTARDFDRRESAEDAALSATPRYIASAIERDQAGASMGFRAIADEGMWRFERVDLDEADPYAPGGEFYVSSVPGQAHAEVRAVVPLGFGGRGAEALLAVEEGALTGGWEVAARVALLGEVFGGLFSEREFEAGEDEWAGERAPCTRSALAMAQEAARVWRAKTPTVDSAMREVGRGVLTGKVNLDEAIGLYGSERILASVTFAVLDGVEHVLYRVRKGERAVRWWPTAVGAFARTKSDSYRRGPFVPVSRPDGTLAYRRECPEGLCEVAGPLAPRRVYPVATADVCFPLSRGEVAV